MKDNITILVSGASGIVGYGILRSLKKANGGYRLVGTSIYENSVADTFCDIFEKAPASNDDGYIDWLIRTIKKHNVNMIIPSIEIDVTIWTEHREKIEKESGAFILLNQKRLIELCADKWLFYQELQKHNSSYAIPTLLTLDNKLEFPLLLKPRRGSASKGIVIVKNTQELEAYVKQIGTHLMVQPIIGSSDEEYTTSAFFDDESNLCCHMTLKRTLSKEGFTETAETVTVNGIKGAIEELAYIFKPVGPTNFQFRVHNSQLKLLEINPRISSATSIRTAFGYNESAMSVDYFINNNAPSQPVLKAGRAARYIEDMIL